MNEFCATWTVFPPTRTDRAFPTASAPLEFDMAQIFFQCSADVADWGLIELQGALVSQSDLHGLELGRLHVLDNVRILRLLLLLLFYRCCRSNG